MRIAVIGTGISGMAAAWLLQQRHEVTVYEAESWVGGHTHTVEAGGVPVDTGFIVYNEATYPNLIALFAHLGVATRESDMSFGFSGGGFEYGGGDLRALIGGGGNLLRPRFWRMLLDLLRFYRQAPAARAALGDRLDSLGSLLDAQGYSQAFQQDHLLPMAAAIWSCPSGAVRDYPAAAFLRFCDNHGLVQLRGRPVWRSVVGGSRSYVAALTRPYADRILQGVAATSVRQQGAGAAVQSSDGATRGFDQVVLACHADTALGLLADADPAEHSVLGAFGYSENLAVLHADPRLMPRRRGVWSSWNFLSDARGDAQPCVTYWMNRLQGIVSPEPLFVTLNPPEGMELRGVLRRNLYTHPRFDAAALRAQGRLWSLQGRRNRWFCGAYFGSGFHEDGLQAGLAVAEALGGVRRPWSVADESGRIQIGQTPRPALVA